MICKITPTNRSFHEGIFNSFVEIKGKDFYEYRVASYIIKIIDGKVMAGMCLYPSLMDNPIRGVLQNLGVNCKELMPNQGSWFVSDIINGTMTSLQKNKTLVMELVLSLINFGIKNQISSFICLSKNNFHEILKEFGIPPLILYPRMAKEASGGIVSRIEVNYTVLRFLERLWNEELENVTY